MGPFEIAQQIAQDGRVQELTTRERSIGANRVFRLWVGEETRILKVYGTAARERRERHSLEALDGIAGIPVMLDSGTDDDLKWVLFRDGGDTRTLLQLVQAEKARQGRDPASRVDLRFGTGPDGRLFVLNKHDGVIREVVR